MRDVTQPQIPPPPTSTGAQRLTALAVTPVGILAMVLLIPLLGCCGFCLITQFLGSR